MKHCCEDKEEALAALRASQARILTIILAINAVMFLVEATAGWLTGSTALLADSLDMLGDASVYGFSLYVVHRGARWRARAATAKGVIMAVFGVAVLVEAGVKLLIGTVPDAGPMGAIALVALLANTACLSLLWRHRRDDVNMRSTWICSRNDILANVGVIGAAVAVAATGSLLPDVLVGTAIAVLFLLSARGVLGDAAQARRDLAPASGR